MNQAIIKAIENSNLLEFDYNGHHRVVEPHTYDISTKGNETLAAYQIEGTSEYGVVPDWKQFTTDKIINLQILDNTFTGTREKYKRGDSRMSKIYTEL